MTGLGGLRGKKAASLAQQKPRISPNFDGHWHQGKLARPNKDKADGSPSASKKALLIKNQSSSNEAKSQHATGTRTAAAARGNQGRAPAVTTEPGQPAPAKISHKRSPQGPGYDKTGQRRSAVQISWGDQGEGKQKSMKTDGPCSCSQTLQVPELLSETLYDEMGQCGSAAQISWGT